MNYRHAFHAGNFADVLKHAVLVRILVHLRHKPAAFRVIDTHAGAGRYDLAGPEAARSGEWRDGIGRLWGTPLAEPARELLAPYLDAIATLNPAGPAGALSVYPGSPALVRAFLRPQDRLVACELEPNAAAALGRYLHGDRRSKAVTIDGWTALNAYVPPPERRGLVLIDPPFEDAGDFPRLAHALAVAYRKWASGSYLVWYPIKERKASDAMERQLRRSSVAKILRLELDVAMPARRLGPTGDAAAPGALAACGLIVVNPPWTLAAELQILLPALATVLSGGTGGAHRVDWLTSEK
jgi:23S rRNA (adenine2030-N6)-methyltransferase